MSVTELYLGSRFFSGHSVYRNNMIWNTKYDFVSRQPAMQNIYLTTYQNKN